MMSSVFNWFTGSKGPTNKKESTNIGLPASWYRSQDLFELERRAIFSKKWLLVTHKNRFRQAGDYVRITEAGFSFLLCLDRDGNIGGFHNVCRHRGFPLIHNNEGNTKILSCKYHGWSYGISGKLAKAPYFEDFENFSKDFNSLLPVHVYVDKLGFVWVNLDANPSPLPWTKQFEGVDTHQRFSHFNFDDYQFDHTWNMQGEYNWKTLADNYNECLHCRTAHPDTNGKLDLNTYMVDGKDGYLSHWNKMVEDDMVQDFKIASTYYFPNACMTVSPHFFYLMRCVPTSALTCSMEYEVYRHKDASDSDFKNIDELFKRILAEDKWLCNNTQNNLNAGIYVNGPLHPHFEQGPVYFQSLVEKAVYEHQEAEEKQNAQIWPATPRVLDQTSKERMKFCDSLSCEAGRKEVAW